MHHFCFNDCIPLDGSTHSILTQISSTLIEYRNLKVEFPNNVDGVITTKEPRNVVLNKEGYTLFDSLSALDQTLRRYAFSVFLRYPIETHLKIIDEDTLIRNSYSINVNGSSLDALNAAIVAENDGILFTCALHVDLEKDLLEVSCSDGHCFQVRNLFGQKANTGYLRDSIKKELSTKLNNYDKLCQLLGNHKCSERFKKGFANCTAEIQQSIIEHFEAAINRGGPSKFFADKDLIKDVTPERYPYKVFELRIFTPVAYRVYFHETSDKVYLALAEKKPADKVQNSHINSAAAIIYEQILFENKA